MKFNCPVMKTRMLLQNITNTNPRFIEVITIFDGTLMMIKLKVDQQTKCFSVRAFVITGALMGWVKVKAMQENFINVNSTHDTVDSCDMSHVEVETKLRSIKFPVLAWQDIKKHESDISLNYRSRVFLREIESFCDVWFHFDSFRFRCAVGRKEAQRRGQTSMLT